MSTVPGEEFGHMGYMRLSFAVDIKEMNRAIERMNQLIKDLT